MRIKSLLFMIMCVAILLLPNTVLAANKLDIIPEFNDENIYEFYDDNTVRVTKIGKGNNAISGIASSIPGGINGSDGEEYKITSISANALDDITEKQDLYVHATKAPKLETTNPEEFFKNINAIYIPLEVAYIPELNATGYTEENGWPTEKIKNYIITEQPKALTEVTAGTITSEDILSVRFTIPAAGGSLQYAWYDCDKDGNILDKENCISNEPDLQIPTDLTYDHENSASKDYYFRCIVGDTVNIQEYSDVAKVTVKPGTYKISFNYSSSAEEATENVVLSVNDKRKLNTSDISKIPTEVTLAKYKEGASFVGWTADYGETIFDINYISTMTFDKNMELYPVWKTKINIDTNGGKFEDGSTVFSTYISNFGIFDKEPTEPKLNGDEIIGLSYDRMGEKLYEGDILTEETTLYVKWKLYQPDLSVGAAPIPEPDLDVETDSIPETNLGEKDDTPKTGNNLPLIENTLFILLALTSILAVKKLRKKVK